MTDLVAYAPYYNFLWLIDDDLYFNLSLWFFKIFFESKGIFDKAFRIVYKTYEDLAFRHGLISRYLPDN